MDDLRFVFCLEGFLRFVLVLTVLEELRGERREFLGERVSGLIDIAAMESKSEEGLQFEVVVLIFEARGDFVE